MQTFSERASLDGPDLAAEIDTIRPELLIVDINAWGALCVAEASGIPAVTFSPYTPALRSPGLPPAALVLESASCRVGHEFFRCTSLLLITTAEPFEYHHPDWGDDILLMGASAWEPPQGAPSWLKPGAWPPGRSQQRSPSC